MKKLINPVAAGGAPLFGDTVFGPIIQDIYSALEGVLANIQAETQGVIVSGCVVSGAGPYDCTSGIVYLNGKFMDFPGFTAQTFTKYIVPASATNTAKTFFDGVSRNILTVEDAALSGSIPGSGQYITISSTSPRKLTNYVSPQTTTLLDGKLSLNGLLSMLGNLDMNGFFIYGLVTPVNSNHAANKGYVDGVVASEATARQNADSFRPTISDAFTALITDANNQSLRNIGIGSGSNFPSANLCELRHYTTGSGSRQIALDLVTGSIYTRTFTIIGSTWSGWTLIN